MHCSKKFQDVQGWVKTLWVRVLYTLKGKLWSSGEPCHAYKQEVYSWVSSGGLMA